MCPKCHALVTVPFTYTNIEGRAEGEKCVLCGWEQVARVQGWNGELRAPSGPLPVSVERIRPPQPSRATGRPRVYARPKPHQHVVYSKSPPSRDYWRDGGRDG